MYLKVPGKSYRKVTLNELNQLLPFEKSATGGINLKYYFEYSNRMTIFTYEI